jgi:hypothetical protein
MKYLGAKKVQDRVANMTREEEIEFWKERSQHLRQYQETIKKNTVDLQDNKQFEVDTKPHG